jgi:hypothetical protein
VTDLRSLVDYLRTVRDELSNPRPDTATSGRLKLYKLFVCVIHALDGYLKASPRFGVTAADFVDAAISHGQSAPPKGLSANGITLWTATFDAGNMRSRHCMAVLVAFADADAKRSQPSGSKP